MSVPSPGEVKTPPKPPAIPVVVAVRRMSVSSRQIREAIHDVRPPPIMTSANDGPRLAPAIAETAASATQDGATRGSTSPRLDDGHAAWNVIGGPPPGPQGADGESANRRVRDPPPVARPRIDARIAEHTIRDRSGEPEVAEPEEGEHATDHDGEGQQLSIPRLVDRNGRCHDAFQR
jgi:hypothetical protein